MSRVTSRDGSSDVRSDTSSTKGNSIDGNSIDSSSIDGNSIDGNSIDGSNIDSSNIDSSNIDGSSIDGNSIDQLADVQCDIDCIKDNINSEMEIVSSVQCHNSTEVQDTDMLVENEVSGKGPNDFAAMSCTSINDAAEIVDVYSPDEIDGSQDGEATKILYDTYSYSDDSSEDRLHCSTSVAISSSPTARATSKMEPLDLGPSLRRGLFSSKVKLPDNLVHPSVMRGVLGKEVDHVVLDVDDQLCGDIFLSETSSSDDDECVVVHMPVQTNIESSSLSTASSMSLQYDEDECVIDLRCDYTHSNGRQRCDNDINCHVGYNGPDTGPRRNHSMFSHEDYIGRCHSVDAVLSDERYEDMMYGDNELYDHIIDSPKESNESLTPETVISIDDIREYLDPGHSSRNRRRSGTTSLGSNDICGDRYSFGRGSLSFRDLVLSKCNGSVMDIIDEALKYYLSNEDADINPQALEKGHSFTKEMREILRLKVVKELGIVPK